MNLYRLAIIADIHGILPSLEAVLSDLQEDSPDMILVGGDFLGGPQPLEVLALLREVDARYILGNGEVNLLKMHHGKAPVEWGSHRQFDMARWIYQQLSDQVFEFLQSIPQQMVISPQGADPIRIVHGAPWDVNKLVFPGKEPEALRRALNMISEGILVFAHTHLPNIYHRYNKLAVNPGSVSNNLNGDTRASYATLTWNGRIWHPELHFVDYDLGKVVKVFKESGFLEANRPLSRAFLESILTGENTAVDYIIFAQQTAKELGYPPVTTVPDAVWLKAETTFPWKFEF